VTTELYAKEVGSSAPPTLIGERTLVVRSTGELVLLPEDETRVPVFSARLNLRWYPSDILTLVAFVILTYDNNATVLEVTPELSKSRVFQDPFRFGAGLTAQARF